MDSSHDSLVQACLRAINVVYSAMLVVVLPPVLWFFLFLDLTVVGVIALGCAVIYAPALLGFFPRQADRRIGLACALMILVALAVNSAGGWQVQPGLWLLVVPCFLVGIIFGHRRLAAFQALCVLSISVTSFSLGPRDAELVPGIIGSILMWLAVTWTSLLLFSYQRRLAAPGRRHADDDALIRENNAALSDMVAALLRSLHVSDVGLTNAMQVGAASPQSIKVLSQQLTVMVDDLTQALAPNDNTIVETSVYSLGDLAQHAEQHTLPYVMRAGVKIKILAPLFEPRLLIDAEKINAIVSHLVRNACRRTSVSLVMVVLFLEELPGQPSHLRIAIDDDGEAITDDEKSRLLLFLRQSAPKEYDTGVSLFLARQWTAFLGGRLELVNTSRLGGVRFNVSIPTQRPGIIRDASAPLDEAKRVRDWARGKRIMVVEDNPTARDAIERLLEDDFAMIVGLAVDGIEAMQLFEAQPFDIIMTNYALPNFSGAQFIRLLRAAGHHLPIIAITEVADLEVTDQLGEAGANGIMTKPIEATAFRQALSSAISALTV